MRDSTSEAKRYLASNVLTNFLAVFVGAAINIWLTPYLIRKLGLEVYGMIPLVISFVAYLNLFTMSISSSVSRYVAICAGRGESEMGSRYLSSAVIALLVFCGASLIPIAAISINFSKIFQVPPGYESSSGWLFFHIMLAGGLFALASPYQVSTFVRHRFDLNNAVDVGAKILRMAVIVACFTWLGPSLGYFGVAYSLMALAFLISFMVLTRILTPEFRIDLRDFDLEAMKEMGRMTGWITVNQVGAVLYISVSFIIINLFLGPGEVGRYGPVAQLAVLLSTLGGALSNVFAPIAFEYIARDQLASLVIQLQRAIKFLGLIVGFAVGILCGLAEPMLRRWLGAEFADPGAIGLASDRSVAGEHCDPAHLRDIPRIGQGQGARAGYVCRGHSQRLPLNSSDSFCRLGYLWCGLGAIDLPGGQESAVHAYIRVGHNRLPQNGLHQGFHSRYSDGFGSGRGGPVSQ